MWNPTAARLAELEAVACRMARERDAVEDEASPASTEDSVRVTFRDSCNRAVLSDDDDGELVAAINRLAVAKLLNKRLSRNAWCACTHTTEALVELVSLRASQTTGVLRNIIIVTVLLVSLTQGTL